MNERVGKAGRDGARFESQIVHTAVLPLLIALLIVSLRTQEYISLPEKVPHTVGVFTVGVYNSAEGIVHLDATHSNPSP
jgi:hypothetical protein